MSPRASRAAVGGALALLLALGPVGSLTPAFAATTAPNTQQTTTTLSDVIKEAQRIAKANGDATVTAADLQAALTSAPGLGHRAWEQSVTFSATSSFSGAFGQFSIATAPDGTVGLAMAGQNDCSMATISPAGKVSTFSFGSLGKNCSGATALRGPNQTPPSYLDPIPPAVPAGLSAVAGESQVKLAWNAVGDADLASYNVYANGTLAATVPAGTTTAVVSGLTDYTSYSFTVTAVDTAANESAPSAAVSATPVDLTPPGVPAGLTANAGESQVTLSWQQGPEADYASTKLYQDGALIATVPAGTTSFTVTGLTDYQPYAFTASSVDVHGNESAQSAAVTAVPVDLTPPGVPTDPNTTAGESQVTVNWDAVDAADLASYNVYRNGTLVGTVPAGTTSFTVIGLTDYTTYLFSVSAVDVHGNESAQSLLVTGTPVDLTPPSVPTDLAAAAGESHVTLTWTASPEADTAGYYVYENGGTTPVATVAGPTADVAGLTDYTSYDFTVAAFDTHGNVSATTAAVTATPIDLTPPPVPGTPSTVAGDGSLQLSWGASDAPDLAGYNVYVDGALVQSLDATTTELTLGGLTDYQSYTLQVTAFDVHGNESAKSDPVTATPIDLTAPDQITGVTVTPAESSLATSWAPSAATDLGGYRVYVDGQQVADLPAGTTSFTMGGLTDYQSYDVTVTAYDVHGNESVPSAPVSANPVDLTPPAVPANPVATAGESSATLSWDADTDPDLDHYEVYVNGAATLRVPAGTSSVTLPGLTDYTTYTLTVSAVDVHANESAQSVPVTATPVDLTPPGAVTGLKATAGNAQVALTWTAPADKDVASYRIYANGVQVATSTTPSATITGLTNGTAYTFTVSAVDVHDNVGVQSAPVTATPTGVVLAAPTNLAATAGDSQVKLTWAVSATTTVTGYRVYQDGALVATVNGRYATTTTIAGLTNGTTYRFSLAAVDAGGNASPQTAAVSATPVPQPAGTSVSLGFNSNYGSAEAVDANGNVYVLGGATSYTYLAAQSTAKMYNAATKTWVTLPAMPRAREFSKAVFDKSGRLFVFGGVAGTAVTQVDMYDPATNTWSTPASISVHGRGFSLVQDANGVVTILAGTSSSGADSNYVERYDPNTNTYQALAPLPRALGYQSAVIDSQGQVYVIGGQMQSAFPQDTLSTVYRLNAAGTGWTTLASTPTQFGIAQATATIDANDQITVTGGQYAYGSTGTWNTESAVLRYNPATNVWTKLGSLPNGMGNYGSYLAAAVIDGQGNTYVVGGSTYSGYFATIAKITASGAISQLPGYLVQPRGDETVALSPDGKSLYVAGGVTWSNGQQESNGRLWANGSTSVAAQQVEKYVLP